MLDPPTPKILPSCPRSITSLPYPRSRIARQASLPHTAPEQAPDSKQLPGNPSARCTPSQ
ncbi:hypothetical protein L873DRAFT_1807276 [Choiromyces venosus 120613-1]|uniref:Uncharacterized protein n=1 Tax=Choiromyces venosus 120613-1 TaxID=1336337 RepID=A0A3N4JLE9_9PEZI|nr:hypothetical protein L873DRAFT_1807276 [Choiromyces venosus 120613-1]